MARFVGTGEAEFALCTHMVRTQHHSMLMLSAMHDWCHEHEDSSFYHLGENDRSNITFVFSDPDTAFAFRMRWT